MIWCVVPAAGRGQRFGAALPKQYAPLVSEPMIVRTLDRLAAHPRVSGLMVALAKDDPSARNRYWRRWMRWSVPSPIRTGSWSMMPRARAFVMATSTR